MAAGAPCTALVFASLSLILLSGCSPGSLPAADGSPVASASSGAGSVPEPKLSGSVPSPDQTGIPTRRTESRPPPPVQLIIPGIHVNAPVEAVGITPDGSMDVPSQWNDAAWFEPGYRPGEDGNAVIVGHLDSLTGPALFWDLGKLKLGDT